MADSDTCTDVCKTHPNKTLEYFCSEHGELCCSVCMALNHRTCKQVDHIPDIANDILFSTEYANLQENITALTIQTNSNIQTLRGQIKRAQTYHASALEDLKHLITDIRVAADEMESSVVRKVDRMKTEVVQRLQLFEDTCKMALGNIEAMRSMLTGLQNRGQLCQMFIAMKRAKQEMHSIETRLSETGNTIEAINYRLVTSREAQTFLDSPETMITLEIFQETQTASSDTPGQNDTIEATVLPKQHTTPVARQCQVTVFVPSIKATIIIAFLAILLAGQFYHRDVSVHHKKECFHTHLRPNYSRFHVPLDQNQMPKIHHQMPKDQQPMQKDQQQMPKDQQQMPKDQQLIPTYQQQMHKDQQQMPKYQPQMPKGHQPMPKDQQLMPKGQQQTPKDHHTMLKDQEEHTSSSETYGHNATSEATVLPKQHNNPAKRQGIASACVPRIKAIISAAVLLLAILLAGVFYQHAASVHKSRDAWETRADHVLDINVRYTDDRLTPWVTGSVVLHGDKLVAVDGNNCTLKLIDLTYNTLLSQLVLQGEIWDITIVSDTQVALTSFNIQTIYTVHVSDILKLESEVKVKGECRGVASINDNLVVSYVDPVKVEIVSMTGQVLQTVVAEDAEYILFASPYYVAVSRDQQTIYISDWYRATVTSVDLSGHVQATYKSNKLVWPRGLTVDSTGKVYVCDEYSHNILQLTADLTEIQQLLQESDGVVYTYYVYYCETTDRLYVGMYESDVIKIYQFK